MQTPLAATAKLASYTPSEDKTLRLIDKRKAIGGAIDMDHRVYNAVFRSSKAPGALILLQCDIGAWIERCTGS